MFKVKINGTTHEVTVLDDGSRVYDPPIPGELQKKFNAKCQDMLKNQKAPGHRSDTQFHAGRGTLLQQLEGDENWAKHLAMKAKKRGYNVGANDVYIGQLDDGDLGNPDAFFKSSEGLAEMKRRCERTGKGCDMPGLHVAPDPNKIPKAKALNPKVTKRLVGHYRKTGEADGKTNRDLKEYIEKKHGRPVNK